METYIIGLALGILVAVIGRKIMADTSKLQASLDKLVADQAAKFKQVQAQLDSLNGQNDPAEQAKIDAISAQVDAIDQALQNFDVPAAAATVTP
jgi:hypothetical protein